jgi:predicted flap endonuclease-1-like 5' DNA nuclease
MSSDTNHEIEGDLPRSIGRTARRVLAIAGYTELAQLTSIREAELLRLHGVGPKAIRLLREALAAQDLTFAERDR